MKQLKSLLMIMMLILVVTGCTSTGESKSIGGAVSNDEGTVSQMEEGFIFEVTDNSVLVLDQVNTEDFDKTWNDISESYKGSAIWLQTNEASTLMVGQKVQYWIDGPVAESFPMQGSAEKIEVIAERSVENKAFRNIKVTGLKGKYTITGEGRVFEVTMNYAVSDGHNYLVEDFLTLDMGAPEWSAFTLDIQIPEEKLPLNGTLILELFEYSAEDGSVINLFSIPLESFR
ncbi:DUF3221 domain-containing protein [Paenibacillus crassostreae]|uniref:Bacterial spore germination immunoglobulin-like domain-containing protein n=1 Tax=Paenibacillus crassostreae TaxID=1763538 RepID=A0A167DUX0_9BACL|nr:DUF3221 domain-containing protein [Paenibacillus crassostreae]AOZ91032.1 hypothetical protein LPB68_01650 [Paenibacillus crassostreae]OAB74806.1 hypothetical protein PNBC_12305 [Paenibacillus crassostreae]